MPEMARKNRKKILVILLLFLFLKVKRIQATPIPGSDEVLHVVDLGQIPSEIKESFREKIIESIGNSKDLKFIN
jgi:hypothetical protein